MAREEEEKRREQKKQDLMEEQRESTVSVIRAQWELAHPELRYACDSHVMVM